MPIACPRLREPKVSEKISLEDSEKITAKHYAREFGVWMNNPAAEVSSEKKEVLDSIIHYIGTPETVASLYNLYMYTTKKNSYRTCLEIFNKADLPDLLFMLHVINQIAFINDENDYLKQTTLGIAKKHLQAGLVPYQHETKKSIAGLAVVIASTGVCVGFKSLTYAGYVVVPVGMALLIAALTSNYFVEWRLQQVLKNRLDAAQLIRNEIAAKIKLCESHGTPFSKVDQKVKDAVEAEYEKRFALMGDVIVDSWSKPIEVLNEITDLGGKLCVSSFHYVKAKLTIWQTRVDRAVIPLQNNAQHFLDAEGPLQRMQR